MKKKLIAGNWKMNGSLAANAALLDQLHAGLPAASCLVAVCVPAAYLHQVISVIKPVGALAVGAQDVSAFDSGAYTGETSAAMLRDLGVHKIRLLSSPQRIPATTGFDLEITGFQLPDGSRTGL